MMMSATARLTELVSLSITNHQVYQGNQWIICQPDEALAYIQTHFATIRIAFRLSLHSFSHNLLTIARFSSSILSLLLYNNSEEFSNAKIIAVMSTWIRLHRMPR